MVRSEIQRYSRTEMLSHLAYQKALLIMEELTHMVILVKHMVLAERTH